MECVPLRRAIGKSRLDGGSGSSKVIGAREDSIMVLVSIVGVGPIATGDQGRLRYTSNGQF